jgi:agarase
MTQRRPSAFLFVLACMLACCRRASADSDPRGGYKVVKDDRGVWWFENAAGERFVSIGVNNVSDEPYAPRPNTSYYAPVASKYAGDKAAWGTAVRRLLADHGFNTLGAWSAPAAVEGGAMRCTPVLYVVEGDHSRCLDSLRPDFESYVRANTKAGIARIAKGADVLGVFLDNEMPWFGKSGWDEIPTYTLLEKAFELGASDVRRLETVKFLERRHGSLDNFAKAWGRPFESWDAINSAAMQPSSTEAAMADRDAYTAMLADRFFEVSAKITREEMPGTLILGVRFPGNAPESVIRACGRHCDVVSVNQYVFESRADERTLARFWLLGGRPLMHTEFSWRARSNASGNPNTRGASAIVETQAERGAAYEGLVPDTLAFPVVIGSHWFEFSDQSPQGRFDGEDSNYGIVDIHDQPYAELLASMARANRTLHDLHAATTRTMPTSLPQRLAVTYAPGQHPGRPPTLDLLQPWVREPEAWGAPDASMRWSREGDSLVLEYDAGSQYGAGINIFGPASCAIPRGPAGSTDLDGYFAIELDITAPKGLQLNVVLAEAGSGPPSSKFDLGAGDDGESYIADALFGTGERTTLRVPIASFRRQLFHGNQAGAFGITMNAMKNLGLQASGAPRTGRIILHAFRLVR